MRRCFTFKFILGFAIKDKAEGNLEMVIEHRNLKSSLRKQPSFFAPSCETPLGLEAKKDGCFRRLPEVKALTFFSFALHVRELVIFLLDNVDFN